MTICRYFQQGTCRFGNRCRFDHVYASNQSYSGGYTGGGDSNYYRNNYNYGGGNYNPGSGNYNSGASTYHSGGNYNSGGGGNSNERGGTSILRAKAQTNSSLFAQPTSNTSSYQPGFFSPGVNDSKPAPVQREVKEILQMLINEFTLWEHSGQWPLSCFSLFKEQGCFPGLIDYSPEEIRWYMYQSRAMGNFEECQQLIKGMYDKVKHVREQLVTPSPEVIDILTRLSRGEKIEAPVAPLVFDKPAQTTSIFGNASGGNAQPAVPVASSFTFTLPNKETPAANNQNFSGFGAPQGTVFSNTFANPIFSNMSTSNSSPSIFGGAGHPSQVVTALDLSSRANGFLSASSNNTIVSDSGTYTPMEEMTEEMLNAFNAPVYAMGSVPNKPPPKELCGLRS
ncbi:hypothetical protein R5R35_013766 [Gryllus longicercus]|uniref:Nucleoporin NUP42 n=1 Tax=Gryllus longicercus TaxID=2509291 RepID=A0AAN9VW18_9ORTH